MFFHILSYSAEKLQTISAYSFVAIMATIMNLADIMKHENIQDERHDIFLKQQMRGAIY